MGYIILKDENLFGEVTQEQRFELPAPTVTLRDIISLRVEEEVKKHNDEKVGRYQFLLDLAPAARRRDGKLSAEIERRTQIDSAEPIAKAIAAFEANAFFVLVGDRQLEHLDEEIPGAAGAEITFLKLTQLIGG